MDLHLQKLLKIKEGEQEEGKNSGYAVFGPDYIKGEGFPRPKLTITVSEWIEMGMPVTIDHQVTALTHEAATTA